MYVTHTKEEFKMNEKKNSAAKIAYGKPRIIASPAMSNDRKTACIGGIKKWKTQ